MSRTIAPSNTLLANSSTGITDPTPVTCASGVGNGITFDASRNSPLEQTVFRVSNSSGGAGTITALAGQQPLAVAADQGSMPIPVANSATVWIGPFESGRFMQSDGSLILESSVALSVTAFVIPRR